MFVSRLSRSRKEPRYSTDDLALMLHEALVKDFQSVLPNFRLKDANPREGLSAYRDSAGVREYSSTSVYRFKAHAQMDALLKKYRFANDVYSDAELESRSIGDFFKFQEEISSVHRTSSPVVHSVLQRARKIARKVLGKYEESEMLTYCRFGTNSSIGCPLASAHIDIKLTDVEAFTGSSCIAKWFKKNVYDTDILFRSMFDRFTKKYKNFFDDNPYLRTESLRLQTVPKTWKIYRVITPLALLDLYYSNGYGGYVTKKLTRIGLDISRLQQRHKRLVEKFSVTRTHVTADLTRASDCITSWLLNSVLPRDWFVALKPVLKNQLDYGDDRFYTSSVLPMGNGATFPVETLVFYCVLKAIQELGNVRGLVSVYGDDVIYPSQMHKYVNAVFPMLGFKLNLEKTFNRAYFRESCGSDYYRGCDVRPYYFKGEHRLLSKTKLVAEIYKVINGLHERWEWVELKHTFRMLFMELIMLTDGVFRVPPSYPSTSGVKVRHPSELPTEHLGLSFVERTFPFQRISAEFADGTSCYVFSYLSETADKRFVITAEPYYWLLLNGLTDEKVEYNVRLDLIVQPKIRFIRDMINTRMSQLTWKKVMVRRYRKFRNKNSELVTVKQMKEKWRALVSEKQCTHYQSAVGSVTDWI